MVRHGNKITKTVDPGVERREEGEYEGAGDVFCKGP